MSPTVLFVATNLVALAFVFFLGWQVGSLEGAVTVTLLTIATWIFGFQWGWYKRGVESR